MRSPLASEAAHTVPDGRCSHPSCRNVSPAPYSMWGGWQEWQANRKGGGDVLVQRDRSRNYITPSFDVSPNNLSETVFLISFPTLSHN